MVFPEGEREEDFAGNWIHVVGALKGRGGPPSGSTAASNAEVHSLLSHFAPTMHQQCTFEEVDTSTTVTILLHFKFKNS